MFDEFFADVKKPPVQAFPPVKNHTDAQVGKKSPYGKQEEYDSEEDNDLEESMTKDGKIDFDELFKRSNKLHSRQTGDRLDQGSKSVGGRILKSSKKGEGSLSDDDDEEGDDFSDIVGLANR